MFLVLSLVWAQMLISESSSGGQDLCLFPLHRSKLIHPRLRHQYNVDENHDPPPQRHHESRLAKGTPEALMDSRFRQEHGQWGLNLLARLHHEAGSQHTEVSAQHLVTVYLAVDVRRLNISLLRWFREGVAAALGVPVRDVHINRLNEEKNCIELFVSSDRLGILEPRPAEEVIQSLNIRVLHRHLGHFGITEVSTEKNVLQGQQRDQVWSRDGFYAVFLFFTILVIVIICLMVLYRLKEKVQLSHRHVKSPLEYRPKIHDPLGSAQSPTKAVAVKSMVQAELPPSIATPIPQQQPITTCRRFAPPAIPIPSTTPAVVKSLDQAPLGVPASTNELKPCPSPFRMKSAAGLQERRGSNVSLVLDMSALGAVEPLNITVVTPREAAAKEYLLSAGRPLTRQDLREIVNNTLKLHAEFAEIPMNFIDPKELDIPNHGTKNRYKTILPNPHSRVILKSKNCNDLLGSYINANYIRGYLGDEKAYVATQGPMVNTVNDFWQMAWQEESPVIVMITKLKEKNEKCVLYWPEKRGIYGRIEVLVNSTRESEHYTTRTLTLKCGNQTRTLQHYWYTSWPDHKTPDSAMHLLELMTDVEAERRSSAAMGPVIVHCSAGLGRTGCFIATTIGCKQLQLEEVVDVLSITCQLRADRGGMIQTGEQYEFVHHALSLFEARLSAETGP
ncbi:receptor-type tyrosine-protein phosphatase R isoform X2 [Eucyclogobius newberryi]|uniref:receptor-type tyrosine-protein phosphatase R isoform X2 n=1 Tax=Eucyclogobius newberryi TaxID=166745 RepID=UPI003B5B72AA